MSFWDRIKPSTPTPTATDARLSSDGTRLELTWDDGAKTTAIAQALRQHCPCAGCVDEWTNQRTLDTTKVPADLTVKQLHPVGNYALTFAFSDGHTTGIYPWKLLREITQPLT
ncbi:DUF971 domain-containing protein [Myxococcus stipitatus]|uniref:DUF971 domain-containing protein n=1 Tax=Myxococcus stipitatus TaxID=83455 RepID=UPI0030D49E0C